MKQEIKQKLLKEFKNKAPECFAYHHYDLAKFTSIKDPDLWRDFLKEPDVKDWINEERNLMNSAELQKLLTDISNSNSIGQAQIINALQKLTEKTDKINENGPKFIYTYIPLNEQQKQADNVIVLNNDPFLKQEITLT